MGVLFQILWPIAVAALATTGVFVMLIGLKSRAVRGGSPTYSLSPGSSTAAAAWASRPDGEGLVVSHRPH